MINEKASKALKHWLNVSPEGVSVKFIKKDGTERVMKCTTNMLLIPEDKHPKKIDESSPDYKPRKVNESVIPVFDMEKSEWRSFTKDSLVSVNNTSIVDFERQVDYSEIHGA